MEAKIKSKEFGIVDLLIEGWRVYSANIKTILPIILCVFIPIDLALAFVPQNTRLYNLVLNLLQFFVGIIATLGIAIVTEKAIKGESINWQEALKFALSKWTQAVGTGLLSGVRILMLTLLFIIPGIIFGVYYFFWDYVVALRDRSGKEALDYSKNLVEGQWWKVFGITFVLSLIAIAISTGIWYLTSLISDHQLFSVIPNILVDIVGSFITVIFVILFLNSDFVKRPQIVENAPSIEAL